MTTLHGEQFLVEISVDIPTDLADTQVQKLIAAERSRGSELRNSGVIERIWRIPGTRNNVGVWRATNATELHSLLSSLPLFPYMTIIVRPLAQHPLEGGEH